MKKLMISVFAVFALAGCVAVPYEPAPAGYYYSPYYAPAPAVSFSYSYHDGYRRHR